VSYEEFGIVRIEDYQKKLESYSYPIQEFIEWKTTQDNNVEVLNETIDYYRYFDATPQAEFLFECVDHTITSIIPEEVSYLQKYDKMKAWLDDTFEMPDNMIALLMNMRTFETFYEEIERIPPDLDVGETFRGLIWEDRLLSDFIKRNLSNNTDL